MDVQLDLSMRTAGVLEGWSLRDYHAEHKCVLNFLSDDLEAHLIDGDRWYKDNQYLYYEDRIVVPEARLDGCLQWAHLSSGHTGCNRSVNFFRERFYAPLTCAELRARMQSIVTPVAVTPANRATRVTRDWSPVCLSPTVLILCYTRIPSTVCLSLVVMTAVWLSHVA